MNRSLLLRLAYASIVVLASGSWQVWAQDAKAVSDARDTIALFQEKDSTLTAFVNESYGYAVFRTVGKGGIGIGGAYGTGVVFEQDSVAGKTSLTQVTVGFQLGGQSYSEVIFFEDRKTLDRFKAGKFEFAAQVSAVAVTAGASANASYSGGVAVFTIAKGGLMYEASVGGQSFTFEAKE